MEPVSRHLGQYIIEHPAATGTYCVFVATYLDPNVVSDFRGRKNWPYYDPNDVGKSCRGMKIIPLDTAKIRDILESEQQYAELYRIFESNFVKEGLDPLDWARDLNEDIDGILL